MKHALIAVVLVAALCAAVSAQEAASSTPPAKSGVSYGLVIDNSGSFRLFLDRIIAVTSGVIEKNGADDEAFLVTFVNTEKIVLRQEFTDRKSDLSDAAENMFIEGGQTAILDAMKSAADYLVTNAKPEAGRTRALVLVTDGEDRESKTPADAVLKVLKENNIRVFVIAMSDVKVVTKLIDRLAKESGGKVFLPKTRPELAAVAGEISVAMRTK